MTLVTLSEANAALPQELFPDWEAATSHAKTRALENMSGFIAWNWFDPDEVIDWTDTATIPAAVKDLLARYADADIRGELYGTKTTGVESTAPVKRITQKAGSLEITKEYAQPDIPQSSYTLDNLDQQMYLEGLAKVYPAGRLARV